MAGRGRGAALTVPAWMKDGSGVRRGAATTASATATATATAAVAAAANTATPKAAGAAVTDWARAESATGRPYWYSRATGRTTWEDPTAPQWVRVEGPGKPYYYDRASRATRWDPPPGFVHTPAKKEDKPDAAAPLASGRLGTVAQQRAVASGGTSAAEVLKPVHEQPPSAQRSSVQQAVTAAPGRERSAAASTSAFVASASAEEGPLPPGWAAYTAPGGRKYYHNAQTGITEWTRPTMGGTAPPSHAGRAREQTKSDGRPAAPRLDVQGPLGTRPAGDGVPSTRNELVRSASDRPPVQPVPAKRRRTRTRAPPRGYVARPKDKDGRRYLRDREAEKYFLGRAQKERDRLAEVDRRARAAAGKGPRGDVGARAARTQEAAIAKRDASEYVHVKKKPHETSWEQRKRFETLMRESGVTQKSSWLETMGRCTPDERYDVDIPMYGHRKLAYTNFVAKQSRADREASILSKIKTEEDFNALLESCFSGEPDSVLALQDCSAEAINKFENDVRFLSFGSADSRAGAIRQYFRTRERRVREKKLARRRELRAGLLRKLFGFTHPDLRPTLEHDGQNDEASENVKVLSAKAPNASSSTSPTVVESQGAAGVEDKCAKDSDYGGLTKSEYMNTTSRTDRDGNTGNVVVAEQPDNMSSAGALRGVKDDPSSRGGSTLGAAADGSAEKPSGGDGLSLAESEATAPNDSVTEPGTGLKPDPPSRSSSPRMMNSPQTPWLTNRTSSREAEERIVKCTEFEELSPKDHEVVLNEWRRHVDARARELSRVCSRLFSEGVEQLVLAGAISFRARWRDVDQEVMSHEFAKSATRLRLIPSSVLPGLFDDGIALFFSRVDGRADDFRAALKRARAEDLFVVSSKTTLNDLKKVSSLSVFLKETPDSIAEALLQERQRKDAKRLDDCVREFEGLLRRRNVDSTTNWNALKATIEFRTAYKQLHELVGGDDGVEAVFQNMVARRERRQKRTRASGDLVGAPSNSTAKRAKLGPMPPPKMHVAQEAVQDEDSGWAAAISSKREGSSGDQARKEERERKKREILAASERT